MALQDKLDAFKADFESGRTGMTVPPSVLAVLHASTEELISSGAASHARKAGDSIAAFALSDQDGREVSSAGLLSRGPLVISFYRGVWCPYCNLELKALQEALPRIEAAGATLVTISPQLPVNSRRSVRQSEIGFPILFDAGNEVAASFGLRFALPKALIEVYRGFGNELPAVNGDPSWTLPMPARFVVRTDGTIVYAEVNPDYTRRPDPDDMMPAIRRAASGDA